MQQLVMVSTYVKSVVIPPSQRRFESPAELDLFHSKLRRGSRSWHKTDGMGSRHMNSKSKMALSIDASTMGRPGR